MTFLTWADYDTAELCRAIGVVGFLTYVANYLALSFRLLTSEHAAYFAINIAAASMVMTSLSQDFNLASALIQGFWIMIGSCAIWLRLRQRRSAAVRRLQRLAVAFEGREHRPVAWKPRDVPPDIEVLPLQPLTRAA